MKTYTLYSLIFICFINFFFAQNLGINGSGSNPHPSALLDVDASLTPSLGILIPRIALQAINVSAPVSGPATSLLLYNTASAGTGTNAVTPGYYYWDGIQWVRFNTGTTIVSGGSGWLLTGNAGTTAGTNFLGTVDNVDFIIKRNNIRAGLISLGNTSFGNNALNPVSTGTNNTAVGINALLNNGIGNSNAAFGHNALYSNTDGYGNNAMGFGALYSNTTGILNTAIGYTSLYNNTTGSYNNAVGYYSLYYNTTGQGNLSFGHSSMSQNITGYQNTAYGYGALYNNTTGVNNIAIGSLALYSAATGSYNIAIGSSVLGTSIVGNNNIVVGNRALSYSSVGSNNSVFGADAMGSGLGSSGNFNTAIGYNANVTGGSSNSTALGSNAVSNSNDKIRFGNAAITVIEGQVAYSFPSDRRFKNSITENVRGLDFIEKLRPVTYKFDTKKFDEFLTQDLPDSTKIKRRLTIDFSDSQNIIHTGFIAQEVEQAAQELGFVFDGVHAPTSKNDNYSVAYSQFVVPLVKAVQELSEKIEELKKLTEQQQKQIELLKAK